VSRLTRADRIALLVLVAVPLALAVGPAVAGHPTLNGDNLTQNFPLRVLSGQLIRAGKLPTWNPDIFSGTPLLAGWNAGALFPSTLLFAVLPPVVAWTANLGLVGVVAGAGCYAFARSLSCSSLASFLGSATFAFTGFMVGQDVHFGLVAGTAFAPWILLGLDRLARPTTHSPGLYFALYSVAIGCTVLSGSTRAISNSIILVALYFLALCWRARHDGGLTLGRLGLVGLGGGLAGIGLGAVQLLPGLQFIAHSERAAVTYSYFSAGSLSIHYAPLLLLPYLAGGYGNFGMPSYPGPYNLPEITVAVGLLPLIAFFALGSPRLRRKVSTPLGIWYVVVIVGALLTLGTNTPLGHLLAHIPYFDGERLQNRNAMLMDFGLAVLFTIFVDRLLCEPRLVRARSPGHADRFPLIEIVIERMVGVIPVVALGVIVTLCYLEPRGFEAFLGRSPHQIHTGLFIALTPYIACATALGLCAGLFFIAFDHFSPAVRARLVSAIALCSITLFLVNASYAGPPPATTPATTATSTALARLLRGGSRYAVFNPTYALPEESETLLRLGVEDLNVLHHERSVQGYASLVSGAYNKVTATHAVEDLALPVLAGAVANEVDLSTLLTPAAYLAEPISLHGRLPLPTGAAARRSSPSTSSLAPGDRAGTPRVVRLEPGHSFTWFLPRPARLRSVLLALLHRGSGAPVRLRLGLLNSSGRLVASGVVSFRDRRARLGLHERAPVEEVVATAPRGGGDVGLAAVAVTEQVAPPTGLARLDLDGVLQGVLQPRHWRVEGTLDGLTVFSNREARGRAFVVPRDATSPSARSLPGATVASTEHAGGFLVLRVDTPRSGLVVEASAYSIGWYATVHPAHGPAETAPVRRLGLVEAVAVPRGHSVVTLSYRPPLVIAGAAISLASLVLLCSVAGLSLVRRRRRRRLQLRAATGGQCSPVLARSAQ